MWRISHCAQPLTGQSERGRTQTLSRDKLQRLRLHVEKARIEGRMVGVAQWQPIPPIVRTRVCLAPNVSSHDQLPKRDRANSALASAALKNLKTELLLARP
jgi:hypothetical protein